MSQPQPVDVTGSVAVENRMIRPTPPATSGRS
jgi:hypothetical protein